MSIKLNGGTRSTASAYLMSLVRRLIRLPGVAGTLHHHRLVAICHARCSRWVRRSPHIDIELQPNAKFSCLRTDPTPRWPPESCGIRPRHLRYASLTKPAHRNVVTYPKKIPVLLVAVQVLPVLLHYDQQGHRRPYYRMCVPILKAPMSPNSRYKPRPYLRTGGPSFWHNTVRVFLPCDDFYFIFWAGDLKSWIVNWFMNSPK